MNTILSFEDEAQAYAEIEAMGYHPLALDFPAEENELHWHDFDSVLYITSGELTVSVEGEEGSVTCGRGAKLSARQGLFTARKQPDTAPSSGLPSHPKH